VKSNACSATRIWRITIDERRDLEDWHEAVPTGEFIRAQILEELEY
jgi:hypothetical protein